MTSMTPSVSRTVATRNTSRPIITLAHTDDFSAPAEVYASDLPDPLALGAMMAALGILTLLSGTLLQVLM